VTGKVPEIVRWSLLNLQVCVPEEYTDAEVIEFADHNHRTGLDHGWRIVRADEMTDGSPERNPCSQRKGCVHVLLSC